MDYKRVFNTLGILAALVGCIFQVVAYGYWWMGLISAFLVVFGLVFISGETARMAIGVISFITSTFNFSFMLWMLIDFIRDNVHHLYHPILFIVFDLIIIACGVLLVLLRNAQLKGKEYNPVIKKFIELDNRD